ncbi:hypothetical protein F5Y03DRAFT_85644 [Xylaria venustula]|nr:hypothetical protein F5Y03DRAFT_85644 [Xylaria venustula]
MWFKFTSAFLGVAALATILGTASATPEEPEAIVAVLHTFASHGLCHCAQKRYSVAVDESGTGRCLSLPRDFKPGSVEATAGWDVFVFETANCSDQGGWLFPQSIQNPNVCHYNLGDLQSYAVLGTDHGQFNVGERRGSLDQNCGTDGQ